MKRSDIQQGRRLARLIDQLTRGGLSVEIFPLADVHAESLDGAASMSISGPEPEDYEEFQATSVIGCLLDALKSRGLTEEDSPAKAELGEWDRKLGERAKAARSIADQVMTILESVMVNHFDNGTRQILERLRFLQIEAEKFAAEQEAEYKAF